MQHRRWRGPGAAAPNPARNLPLALALIGPAAVVLYGTALVPSIRPRSYREPVRTLALARSARTSAPAVPAIPSTPCTRAGPDRPARPLLQSSRGRSGCASARVLVASCLELYAPLPYHQGHARHATPTYVAIPCNAIGAVALALILLNPAANLPLALALLIPGAVALYVTAFVLQSKRR
jgi:hypothetical protein